MVPRGRATLGKGPSAPSGKGTNSCARGSREDVKGRACEMRRVSSLQVHGRFASFRESTSTIAAKGTDATAAAGTRLTRTEFATRSQEILFDGGGHTSCIV